MRVRTVTKLSSVAHCQKQNSFIVSQRPLIFRYKTEQTTGSVAAATCCQSYCLGALTTKKTITNNTIHSSSTLSKNNSHYYCNSKQMQQWRTLQGCAERPGRAGGLLLVFCCNKVTCQPQVALSMFENYLNDSEKLSEGRV